jgi:regulator of RNase E activity RraA
MTNGAVRDLPDIESTGFQLFAGNVAVSHAYAHLFDFGGEVEVGGLKVRPGDLLHGDCHGVQTVPLEIAPQVPRVAREILARRQEIIGLCRSTAFSIEKIQRAIQGTRLAADGEGDNQ